MRRGSLSSGGTSKGMVPRGRYVVTATPLESGVTALMTEPCSVAKKTRMSGRSTGLPNLSRRVAVHRTSQKLSITSPLRDGSTLRSVSSQVRTKLLPKGRPPRKSSGAEAHVLSWLPKSSVARITAVPACVPART